jgi:hypothetical protein
MISGNDRDDRANTLRLVIRKTHRMDKALYDRATAPPWQELSYVLQDWSGAVMCPACLCGDEAAGHNALCASGPNR